MDNYYTILGVSPTATCDEIKRVYKELAKQIHPDRPYNTVDEERFKLVSEAAATLRDESKRALYDQQLTQNLEDNLTDFDQDSKCASSNFYETKEECNERYKEKYRKWEWLYWIPSLGLALDYGLVVFPQFREAHLTRRKVLSQSYLDANRVLHFLSLPFVYNIDWKQTGDYVISLF